MASKYENQRLKVSPPLVPLRALRGALGLTQDAVCEKVSALTDKSFTKGALSAIENGHRGASVDTLTALEVALGLEAGSLVVDYTPAHDRRRRDEQVPA